MIRVVVDDDAAASAIAANVADGVASFRAPRWLTNPLLVSSLCQVTVTSNGSRQ